MENETSLNCMIMSSILSTSESNALILSSTASEVEVEDLVPL